MSGGKGEDRVAARVGKGGSFMGKKGIEQREVKEEEAADRSGGEF